MFSVSEQAVVQLALDEREDLQRRKADKRQGREALMIIDDCRFDELPGRTNI